MTQLSTLAVLNDQSAKATLPAAIAEHRTNTLSNLEQLAVPTRRTEHWKYSAKRLGDLSALSVNSDAANASDEQVLQDALTLKIVNGQVDKASLDAINSANLGVAAKLFSELSDEEARLVASHAAHEHGELEQLNTAIFSDAVFINVSKNTVLDRNILLSYTHSSSGFTTPRVFITLEQSAEATFVEHLSIQDIENAFCANQTTAVVGANAKLTVLRMNAMGTNYKTSTTTRAILKRDSNFESHSLCLGAQMARHDLHVLMTEPGAHCLLNGVVVTKDAQHFDNHTNIEHIASHCTSEENYRCIADDKSQIVFNGRIHIHKDAQKTLGEMNNRNLLLSSSAEIDTKPELEIYADDVKCAHGATIGQLNEKEVYYLKTRGLTDEQARQMLTLSFVVELVRAVPILELAERWEDTLSQLLSFQD